MSVQRPSGEHHAEHDRAIAELRNESHRHAKQLFAHANELDDCRVESRELRAEAAARAVQVERIEEATIANTVDLMHFAKIAAGMEENNKLQKRVLVEQKESNHLKRRQEAQLRDAVETFIGAVRSPRAVAALTLGALLAGFFFALFQRIFQ